MTKRLTIAATGLEGMVGSRVVELLSDSFDFVSLSESKMDITNREQTIATIASTNFDIFLHLAAFTNVDACETNKELAHKINVQGTQNIFDAVSAINGKMIFISTDFVFDGERQMNDPSYVESSPIHPLSYYGETKKLGEDIVKNKGMVVRIAYPYGATSPIKKDVVRTLIELLLTKAPLSGIVDQIMTPTFIEDIAYSLAHLAQNFTPEIYHLVGADSLSGYDLIQTIGDVFELDTSHVTKTTYDDFYKNKAPRPKNMVITSEKNTFRAMNAFREGLESLRKNNTYDMI